MKDNVEIFAHDTSETGIANNYVVHDFRNDQRFRGKDQLKGFFFVKSLTLPKLYKNFAIQLKIFRQITQVTLILKNFVNHYKISREIDYVFKKLFIWVIQFHVRFQNFVQDGQGSFHHWHTMPFEQVHQKGLCEERLRSTSKFHFLQNT